nr:hypothetical protein [Sphingomonas sp. CDS-1]
MIRVALVGAAFFIAQGCTDPGEAAEKRYEMVQRTGDKGEICEAAKAVVDVYLNAGNEEKYKWWHPIANTHCIIARLEGPDGRPGAM